MIIMIHAYTVTAILSAAVRLVYLIHIDSTNEI